jgi:predicted RNase H-like HicB family nuclease
MASASTAYRTSIGDMLDELYANLKEVLELVLEEYEGELDNLPHFVGVQQIEVKSCVNPL